MLVLIHHWPTGRIGFGGGRGECCASYLVDVLALKLGDEGVQALLIGLDADGLEDVLDIGGRGGGVLGEAEEKVSREVLHFG